MVFSIRVRAVFQALLVTFLWSTSWVLIKNNLAEIPPLIFAGLRYSLAFVILLPGLRGHGRTIRRLTAREWGGLALLGLIFYTLNQGGVFLTLNYLEAVTFSLLLNFTAVIVALLGIFFLRETPSWLQWVGIAIFLSGTLIYFAPFPAGGGSGIGYLLAGLTVMANGAAALLGRSVNRGQTIPVIVVTVISMGIGGVLLLAVGLVFDGWPLISPAGWGVILWLAGVNTALAFTLWNKTLQILSAVESSVINNTMLIQIALLAWLFLGEELTGREIGGLALAAVGVLIVQVKRRSREVAEMGSGGDAREGKKKSPAD